MQVKYSKMDQKLRYSSNDDNNNNDSQNNKNYNNHNDSEISVLGIAENKDSRHLRLQDSIGC